MLCVTKSAVMGFCSKGPKNEFERAVVNEPSVFEPLNFYCIVAAFYNTTVAQMNFRKMDILLAQTCL